MRRLGGVAAVALVLSAIAVVSILLAVYGVGCFQLRRPRTELSAGVASSREARPETSRESSNPGIVPIPAGDRTAVADTKTIRIGGVVLDFAADASQPGAPAPGVEVKVIEYTGQELTPPPIRTDADGRFTFVIEDSGRRPMTFGISAEKSSQLREAATELTLPQGKNEALDLVLRRYPLGDLVGTTVDVQDRPLGGIHLEVRFDQATRETDSDPEGWFRLTDAERVEGLEASGRGYVLVLANAPNQLKEGGWDPMRVVLAPATPLVVRIVDGRGQGIAGATVTARMSAWEKWGPRPTDIWNTTRGVPRALSGQDGRAILESVWLGYRLSLEVQGPDAEADQPPRTFERESEGRLVPTPKEEGRPLLLAGGDARELTAVLDEATRIRGVVTDDQARPVPAAYLQLEAEWTPGTKRVLALRSGSDAGGRFEFEIPPSSQSRRFRITASDRAPEEVRAGARIGSLALDLSSGRPTDLVLTLRAAARIAGHVLGADGKEVQSRVLVFAEAGSSALGRWGKSSPTGPEGAFVIQDLEPGEYEIWAQPEEPYGDARLSGIRAGREDLEIRVPAERAAHVAIEVSVHGGNVNKLVVLHAMRWPSWIDIPGVPSLPKEGAYSGLEGWPSSLPWLGSGVGGFEDERGAVSFHAMPTKENPTRIDLDEGFYWIGARGTDGDGRTLYPIGTGLVRVAAGDYHVRFELVPTVRVEGRLVGSDVLDLQVGVARAGRLVEIDVGLGRPRTARPVGADGAFSFAGVPFGENEIWLGTGAELAAGRPSHRQPLAVDAKGVPFLEIPIR